jgi:hypothetical protein
VYSTGGRWGRDSSIRVLEDLPVVIVGQSGNMRLLQAIPPTVTLRLEGQKADLDLVNADQIHARVFVADPSSIGDAELPVEVSGLPPGVSLITTVPDKVTLQKVPEPNTSK